MHRVLVVVEGQTERAVFQRVFAPYFGERGISLQPKVVGKPSHKGGVHRSFESVRKEIVALLKQEPTSTVTTFFDYFRLNPKWPGVADAKAKSGVEGVNHVESELHRALVAEPCLEGRTTRFLPYVQLYELEALLFAGPDEIAGAFDRPDLAATVEAAVAECGGCENINHGDFTHPAKRIETIFAKRYVKGDNDQAHAPQIANRIGMERIRKACPRFNQWVAALLHLSDGLSV